MWLGAVLPDPQAARARAAHTRTALRASAENTGFSPGARAVVSGQSPHALGWAVGLARAGLDVAVIEPDPHDARRAADILARAVALGQAPPGIVLDRAPDKARNAALVIDTAPTPMKALRRACAPDALVLIGATGNTGLAPPAQQVSIDTAQPPPAPGLIELRTLPGTDPHLLGRAAGLAVRLGATPLRTPGFIGAPLRARLEDAVEALIFAGSTPWEVDEALEHAGFAPGPCAAQDRRGLDQAFARHRQQDATGTRRFPCPVLDRMVPEGRLGQKSGVGWYRYPGGGGRVIDPLIEDLSREEAHFAGRASTPLSADDLRRHAILSLIDAAADLSAAGIPAPLVDLVCQETCGFPADLGGPLHLGAFLGFDRVCAVLEHRAIRNPVWAPGKALRALSRHPRLQA